MGKNYVQFVTLFVKVAKGVVSPRRLAFFLNQEMPATRVKYTKDILKVLDNPTIQPQALDNLNKALRLLNK